MDYLEIGPTPSGEDCAQVGAKDYAERSVKECRAYVNMLHRLFPVPEGLRVSYVVRSHSHEFGTYREVAVKYDDNCEQAFDHALKVEGASPEYWDDEAKKELAQ